MSPFSKRKHQKAMEEQQKKEAEAEKPKNTTPIFQMPRHAARDFLASTPSSYAGAHRAQIIEQQHLRRNPMGRAMSEKAGGKAPMSGSSTPIPRSSSQLSTSSSMIADFPPVVTVQRNRPNPFLSHDQQDAEMKDLVPPMPPIPHRYSSPIIPKPDLKPFSQSRPTSFSRPTYAKSPLSTTETSPVESSEGSAYSAASSTHSSIISTHAPQLEMRRVWENGQEVLRTYPKEPVTSITEIPRSLPPSELAPPKPQYNQFKRPTAPVSEEPEQTSKKKKRGSIFGFGKRSSTVAAH
ncbi:MAG: hypothetical protein M1820_004621 [Bogoriella megaspora]|nr:MAG: hypothetical protein M1820_004621 [Bogoriella megaspora]